jgi:small GTP-binding protein
MSYFQTCRFIISNSQSPRPIHDVAHTFKKRKDLFQKARKSSMNTGPGSIKTVFLGESGAGKTSIITAHVQGHFPRKLSPTVGASFLVIPLPWNDTEVQFAIWDTAGQEVYRSLTPMYYHGAKCAVVAFDLTSMASFSKVNEWLSELQNERRDIAIIICGNKCDLEDERAVSATEAESLAARTHLTYVETSAKTGAGLERLFETMAKLVGEANPQLMRACRVGMPVTEQVPAPESRCC